jgi:hypothetical protein
VPIGKKGSPRQNERSTGIPFYFSYAPDGAPAASVNIILSQPFEDLGREAAPPRLSLRVCGASTNAISVPAVRRSAASRATIMSVRIRFHDLSKRAEKIATFRKKEPKINDCRL